MSDGIRISKYISECGISSRRSADKAISEKRVYINDEVAVLGQLVYDGDIVKIDSKAGNKFTSTISIDSINELNLSEGANVVVIIKATSVMVQV